MPVKITLEVPCNHASLAEAASIMASLQLLYPLREGGEPDAPVALPGGPEMPGPLAGGGDPVDFVEAWLSHLGEGSRKFWKLAAQYSTNHATLTFEDLQREYGISRETLRSHHRNAYRAINDERAPDPMPGTWDQQTQRNVYSLSPAVRDRILELTRDDAD